MGNSNDTKTKAIILAIIIVLLFGTIMVLNMFNKNDKNNKNEVNNTSNNENIYDRNTITKNTITEDESVETEISSESQDGLIIVTNQFSNVQDNSGSKLIKVTTSGYENDRYVPTGDRNNPNLNDKPGSSTVEENKDKTAPNISVSYSKKDMTNENVIVTLKFNEPVSQVTNGYAISSDRLSATKEYKQNASEDVQVYDLSGNVATTRIDISNIDKTLPQKVQVSDTLFDTKTIQIKVSLSDNESGINLNACKYKIDDKEEISGLEGYSKITELNSIVEKTVSKDGTYYLHVISVDNAGNTRKDTIKLTVDSVMPTLNIKYSNTAITNKDVTVKITANKEMKDVEGWTSNKTNTVFTKTYTQNVDEEVEFTDLVGRTIKAHIKITNIDKVEPNEPKLSQNIFNTRPVDNSKNIDITLVASLTDNENGSGLNLSKCKYVLNQEQDAPNNFNSASTFTNLEQTLYFSIKENSVYYLHTLLVDNAGNERVTTQTIISDTLNPVVTREYSIKERTNKNVVVTIKSSETLKGTDGWEVYDNGKTLRKEYSKNIGRTIYTFYDLAGNAVSVDVTISNIDQDAPNDSVIDKTLFNTKEFSVVAKISDVGFGLNLDECKYVLTSNEEANFDNATKFTSENETLKLKVDNDGTYYLHTYLKDEVGNEKITSHKIVIDSTKPELEVTYSNVQMTNEDVVVTIKADEEIQSVSGWTLSSDKRELTKTFNANTDTTITVTDVAGNKSEEKISIKNIDKDKPKVEISYSTTTQTIEPVTVTIKANEKIQGIEGWTLSSDGTTLTKVFDENDTQTITIRDIAGNSITESIVVANII